MRNIAFTVMFVVASFTAAFAQTQNPEEVAIRAIFTRMEQYCSECNSKAMAQLFAPDGERVWADATVKGRTAIENTYDAQCSFTKNGKNTFKLSIAFPFPDTADVDGVWTNETTGRSGSFTVPARKSDGQWLFARGQPR